MVQNLAENVRTLIIIVFGIGTLVVTPWLYSQWRKEKDRVSQVTQYALIARDSALVYKNKYDQSVTQVEAARLDNQTMKGLKKDLEEITSRFDNLNKRLNNVEQLSKVTLTAVTTLQGVAKDTVVLRDSVALPAFRFSAFDPHFKVEGIVVPSTKEVSVTPSFQANVYAVTYWKRRHSFLGVRFGRKEYKSEITSDNPYLKFSDYKVVTKKWE